MAEEAPYIWVLMLRKTLRKEMPVARFRRTIHVSMRSRVETGVTGWRGRAPVRLIQVWANRARSVDVIAAA